MRPFHSETTLTQEALLGYFTKYKACLMVRPYHRRIFDFNICNLHLCSFNLCKIYYIIHMMKKILFLNIIYLLFFIILTLPLNSIFLMSGNFFKEKNKK